MCLIIEDDISTFEESVFRRALDHFTALPGSMVLTGYETDDFAFTDVTEKASGEHWGIVEFGLCSGSVSFYRTRENWYGNHPSKLRRISLGVDIL
jgi:hypothetical protein